MFAGLAKLEAFTVTVAFTVRVNLDCIITDFDGADLPKRSSQSAIDTSNAAAAFVLSFTGACATVGPIEAFVVVIVTTMIPY